MYRPLAVTRSTKTQFIHPPYFSQETTWPAWQMVYLIAAAVSAATGLFFLLFSQHDVQPWNYPQQCRKGGEGESGDNDNEKATKKKKLSQRHQRKTVMTVLQKARMYIRLQKKTYEVSV